MEILITHLTRMGGDRVCVAGLDEEGHHIRPVGEGQDWTRHHVPRPLALGNVIKFKNARTARSDFPEDVCVDVAACSVVRRADDDEIRERLLAVAEDSLAEIFDRVEERPHSRWVVPRGPVPRSLGVICAPAWRLVPTSRPEWEAVHFSYRDASLPAVRLSVGDLRLFPDGPMDYDVLQGLAAYCDPGFPTIVSVGLSREFAPHGAEPVHWTMANVVWSGRDDRLLWDGRRPPGPPPPNNPPS